MNLHLEVAADEELASHVGRLLCIDYWRLGIKCSLMQRKMRLLGYLESAVVVEGALLRADGR